MKKKIFIVLTSLAISTAIAASIGVSTIYQSAKNNNINSDNNSGSTDSGSTVEQPSQPNNNNNSNLNNKPSNDDVIQDNFDDNNSNNSQEKEETANEPSNKVETSVDSDSIYNTTSVPSALNFDYSSNLSDINNMPDLDFAYYEEIISREDRSPNKEYYETELMQSYGDKGFKYPGYNYNYESGNNKYLSVDGQRINMMNLVYNERVKNSSGNKVKYSDASWIREQINAKTLKVHPAAKTWYSQQITDETQSVTKHFKIGSTKTGVIPLGLYAAPGEVVTLKFDDDTFKLIKSNGYKGVSIIINNNYWDNYEEGNTGQISNRYPFVYSSFSILNSNQQTLTFGSPFGGNISLKINSLLTSSSDSINNEVQMLNFTVSGAIESLHYVHGFTTEQDWNRQIKYINEGKITAPNFSGLYSWASMNIPFTGINRVGGVNAKTIEYPYEVFKKWNTWQYLSTYIARNDRFNSANILDIKLCDDIWNGAAAWGGGNVAYVPISWGGNAFLIGSSGFTILNSWGLMHEINHSYQQNSAFFSKRGHGETNQVTMMSLALLSDTSRYRSSKNIYSEWNNGEAWVYTNSAYGNIKWILENEPKHEYIVYAALLYAIGAKNYVEYARWDVSNHPNTESGWNGMKEIEALSNYFNIDFWPAFQRMHPYWSDGWPGNYSSANQEQRAIIDKLKKYSSIDFVGNFYAAGMYLYNNQTNEYTYGGDTAAAYEIPAGEDYTFDFGTYINSLNRDFNWDNLQIDITSKNGVPLVKSGKSVIYKASEAFSSDDEFDITITPGEWEYKPSNYVSAYKWKIKVRQVVNSATTYLYNNVNIASNFLNINLINEIKKYNPKAKLVTYSGSPNSLYKNYGTNRVLRQKFRFVAPKNGKYIFNATWNNYIDVCVDGKSIYKSIYKSKNVTSVYSVELLKDQYVDFDIYVYNANANSELSLNATVNGENVNVLSNALAGEIANVDELTNYSYTTRNYLTNDKFKYKPRTINALQFKQANNFYSPVLNYNSIKSSKSVYTLTSSEYLIDRLYDKDSNLEIWGNSSTNKSSLTFNVNFKNLTQVGSLRFGHRTDNHPQARPTDLKVTGVDENGNSVILYDGKYGAQFGDRNSDYATINLNSITTLKSMKIELKNNSYYGLILKYFIMSSEKYYNLDNNISVRDNYIAKTANWQLLSNANNSYNNISYYDNHSLLTTTKYDAIDIKLKNAYGFRIIGSLLKGQSTKIDVYINNEIYKRDLVLNATNQDQFNINLFKYLPNNAKLGELRLTIVHKDNNPLFINYIQTYGDVVCTTPIKN